MRRTNVPPEAPSVHKRHLALPDRCSKHDKDFSGLVCLRCGLGLCNRCVIEHRDLKDHEVLDVEDQAPLAREHMPELAASVHAHCGRSAKEEERVKREIEAYFAELRELMKARQRELELEVEAHFAQRKPPEGPGGDEEPKAMQERLAEVSQLEREGLELHFLLQFKTLQRDLAHATPASATLSFLHHSAGEPDLRAQIPRAGVLTVEGAQCSQGLPPLKGQLLRAIGSAKGAAPGSFSKPFAVAHNGTTLFVADTGNHRVQCFDREGTFLRTWGSEGTAPGQLDTPAGICAHANLVYVSECANHRVSVFTEEGVVVRTWGKRGQREAELCYPASLCASLRHDDTLYLADQDNHCVKAFSLEGRFLRRFGKQGTQDGELQRPTGVAALLAAGQAGPQEAKESVVVVDMDTSRVQVWEGSSGALLQCWPTRSAPNPLHRLAAEGWKCVCVRGQTVVVSDLRNNRVVVLDAAGNFLAAVGPDLPQGHRLNRPMGMCAPGGRLGSSSGGGGGRRERGVLYVADGSNHRVVCIA